MPTRWIAVLGALLSTAGCIGMFMSTERYTCSDDGDCDKGADEACRGVELVVDKACKEQPENDGPYYLSEAEQETCIMFYCAPEGTGTICGDKNCVAGRGCFAGLNDEDEVILDCEDLEVLDTAPECAGFNDAGCASRCVRHLNWKLENPASDSPAYRCLSG